MRVLFETAPRQATVQSPNGENATGLAQFRLILYDKGDQLPLTPTGQPIPQTLAYWRRGASGPMVLADHPTMRGFGTVTIPEHALAGLTDDAMLEMRWFWHRAEARP